jgi:hypothetical protein
MAMSEPKKTIQETMEEYDRLHNIPINVTESITHAEFVKGMQDKTVGFKVMRGEPYQLTTGAKRTVFNILVMLYTVAPLILIPLWAYYESNWVLLAGIAVSYLASFSAARQSKIIFLFTLLCIGYWIRSGFHIHDYITFFFFCALWGYMVFQMAESAQTEYAAQALMDNPNLFNEAIAQERIIVIRRRDS